ncbi:Reverse transcriptase, partial [Phytophthora palmivora]
MFSPLFGTGGAPDAYAADEVTRATVSNEDVAMSLATGHETKAHYQACGNATTASPNAESRRAVWVSTVAVPDGTDQAGNIGPQAVDTVEESAEGVPSVVNIGPQAGGYLPRKVKETRKKNKSDTCPYSVDNRVPRGVKKTSTRAEESFITSRVDNHVPTQTPIPRKDVLLKNMSGCPLYNALDVVDGYYQMLVLESDIPLTTVSTPRGILWERLVKPQGLSNSPATFNRLVTQIGWSI